MMKTSWKFGLHVHNYVSAGQRGPVGQRNPLGQVMWVSNPLDGYGIPFSAVRCLSALSKTLTGPRAKACQATSQGDGEPTPWCTGLWPPSPTHNHWGWELPSLQHNPDVHHSAWMHRGVWECTHMFTCVWMCQQTPCRWRYSLSACLRGSDSYHSYRKIHSNPQTLTRSPRGQCVFNLRGH